MRKFYIQYGIGKAKYLVSFYDGTSKNKDGSNFYDMRIFKNKKKLNAFAKELASKGFAETNGYTD